MLSVHLRNYGVTSLWNVTHLRNLASLLERGILCWNDTNQVPDRVDIAERQVQQRRGPRYYATLRITVNPHAHVPLFFADNTPMLYVTSSDNAVILLELRAEVADAPNVFFSDANVASEFHQLYSDPADLANLDWDVIKDRRGARYPDWKRKRSAEVLIPTCCPASMISKVHVQFGAVLDEVPVAQIARTIIAASSHPRIPVREDLSPHGVRMHYV